MSDGGQTIATAAGVEDLEELNFLGLRCLCAQEMRENRDDYAGFIAEDDTSQASGDAYESYCREIETTAAWGGHVEIQALSKILKAHIRVFSAEMPVLDVGEEFKGETTTLNVCYLKHAFGLGEHYNSTATSHQ